MGMKREWILALGVAAWSLTTAACVPAPKKAYTPDEAQQIGEIDEVMHVFAHHADPLFSIRGNASFTDAEFAKMSDASAVIAAAAEGLGKRHAEKHGGESFANFASELSGHATKLGEAAKAKQATDASAALTAMKQTCGNCHSKHR